MSTQPQQYRGFKPYSIDSKLRVAVPPAWRPPLGTIVYLLPAKVYEMPMIQVLTTEEYDSRIAKLETSTLDEARKNHHRRVLASRCREASINDQGKLLVPKDLATRAEIAPDSAVVLVGVERYFEIWAKHFHDRSVDIEDGQANDDNLATY